MPLIASTDKEKYDIKEYILKLVNSYCIKFSATSLSIEKLAGDASERKFFRIKNEKNDSIILIINKEPFNKENFPYLIQYRLLKDLDVPVAEVLYEDEKKGWILIEDLGDLTLQAALKNLTYQEKRNLYLKAIDILIKFHNVKEYHKKKHSSAFQLEFDTKKFYDELLFFYDNFLCKMLKLNIPHKQEEKIKNCFYQIAAYLSRRPKVFTHRDYHSRNIMIKNSRLFIIDFQDARMGPKTYDIISLLKDSYVDIEEELRAELLNYFLEESGTKNDDEIKKELIYMGIQRNIKAIGTFAYQYCEKGNANYIEYIPRTINYIKENISSISELKDLKENLLEYITI